MANKKYHSFRKYCSTK